MQSTALLISECYLKLHPAPLSGGGFYFHAGLASLPAAGVRERVGNAATTPTHPRAPALRGTLRGRSASSPPAGTAAPAAAPPAASVLPMGWVIKPTNRSASIHEGLRLFARPGG